MTPAKILKAKTAKTAAKLFHEYLCKIKGSDSGLYLWSPEETRERGWGSGWAVCWEEGPYEWTMISAGCTLHAGSSGVYSKPGPFKDGLGNKCWYAEPYNSFVLNFYELGRQG